MLGKKLQEGTSHKLHGGRSCESSQSKALQTELELFKAFCWAFYSLYRWLVQSTLIYLFLSYQCTAPHIHICICVLSLLCPSPQHANCLLPIHSSLLAHNFPRNKIQNKLWNQPFASTDPTLSNFDYFLHFYSVLSRRDTSFCQSLSTGSKIMQEQWRKTKRVMQEYDL